MAARAEISGYFMGYDSRGCPRFKVYLPAIILTADGSVQGVVKDLSLNGALILLGELPDLNTDLDLAIEITEYNETILVKAESVRLEVYEGENPSYGLAIRFTDIAEAELRFLSNQVFR